MHHRNIPAWRVSTYRLATRISSGLLIAAALSFAFSAVLPESARMWAERGFFLGFAFALLAWTTHFAFIFPAEIRRRRYGTALFVLALIASFSWLILSCVRKVLA